MTIGRAKLMMQWRLEYERQIRKRVDFHAVTLMRVTGR